MRAKISCVVAGVAAMAWAGMTAMAQIPSGRPQVDLPRMVGTAAPTPADPLYQSKGDQRRSYTFPPTGEKMPYRTYVPASWKPGVKLPLVVVLHGGGLTDDAPFERTPVPMKNELQALAEQYNFIVVAPMGFNEFATFGASAGPPPGLGASSSALPGGMPRPPGQPVPVYKGNDLNPKAKQYSEQDTLNVIGIVEKEYGVDTSKEFLTGNSMGGTGTALLAARYPEKWLAMAPSESGYDPGRFGNEPYKVKGALYIRKAEGNGPKVESQVGEMVSTLKAKGIDARAVALPDTVHETVWFYALPLTFHFFDTFVHPPAEAAVTASK
jgi:poly(3-hydroxybutyrate) depolymerase